MPVDFRGKDYFTVAERLKMAYGEDFVPPVGIQQVSTRMEDHAGLVVIIAEVVFSDGRRFTGMSAVKSSGTSPAERDAPVETCETSALGRALAFAGYFGSPEGIAGYEELVLAQQRAEARAQARDQGTAAPRPVAQVQPVRFADESTPMTRLPSGTAQVTNYGATPQQIRYARQLWDQANRQGPPPDMEQMDRRAVSALIDELRGELNIPPRP